MTCIECGYDRFSHSNVDPLDQGIICLRCGTMNGTTSQCRSRKIAWNHVFECELAYGHTSPHYKKEGEFELSWK